MSKENKVGRVQVSKNCYVEVCWARIPEKGAAAQLSLRVYVDGIYFQTINCLNIRETLSRTTQQTVLHIGSMHRESEGRDYTKPIYSNTFFPGSNTDAKQEERRSQFVEQLLDAIKEFLTQQVQEEQKVQELRGTRNPKLEELSNIRDDLHKVRAKT